MNRTKEYFNSKTPEQQRLINEFKRNVINNDNEEELEESKVQSNTETPDLKLKQQPTLNTDQIEDRTRKLLNMVENSRATSSTQTSYSRPLSMETQTESDHSKILEITDQFLNLLQSLSDYPILKDLPEAIMANLIAGITSSTFSLLNALYSIRDMKNSKVTFVLQIAAIVSALTHLAICVSTVCQYWHIGYDLYKAKATLKELANRFLQSVNANFFGDMLQPTISMIITVLLAGSTLITGTSFKDVIQLGAVSRAIRTIKTDAKELTEWICEDLLQLDLKGDVIVYDRMIVLAKRSSELLIIPTYEFIAKGELLSELRTLPNEAIELSTKVVKSESKSKALNSARVVLMNNIASIRVKLEAIRAVEDQAERIETIGVLLAGQPGVGKSSFVKYLTMKLGEMFKYSPTLFNLNKQSNGFSLPYGGQAFAVYNEFMAKRSEKDGILMDYNNYVSGDPANLEAAHLEGKVQPVKFRVVFLTANDVNPKLDDPNGGLTTQAAQAFWDRTIRLEIIDENIKGRMDTNAHRRQDYEHLRINLVKQKILNNTTVQTELERTPMTVTETIHLLAKMMAMREIAFIKKNDMTDIDGIEQRLRYLEDIFQRYFSTTANQIDDLIGGREYFTIRLQGLPDTGKTENIKKLVNMYKTHFPYYRVVKAQPKMRYVPEAPCIYVFDDLLYTLEAKRWAFELINTLHERSIVIIATNEVIPMKNYLHVPFFQNAVPYRKIPNEILPSGYARRIGLSGDVWFNDTCTRVPNYTAITIDCGRNYVTKIDGKSYSPNQLTDYCFKKWNEYEKQSTEVNIIHEKYSGNIKPDIELISGSLDELKTVAGSRAKCIQAHMSSYGETKIRVDKEFLDMAEGSTMISDWLDFENLNTPSDVVATARKFATSVNRIKPDVTVRITILEQMELTLINHTIYIYDATQTNEVEIVESDMFYLSGFPLSVNAYVNYVVYGRINDTMQHIPEHLLREVRARIEMSNTPLAKHYKIIVDIERIQNTVQTPKSDIITKMIKDNKILTICGGLLSVYCIYKTMRFAYDRYFTDNTRTSNHVSEPDDAAEEHCAKLRKAIMAGDRAAREAVYDSARKAGVYERVNDFEYEYRSNAARFDDIKTAIATRDHDTLIQLIHSKPAHIAKYIMMTKSNMMTTDEEFSAPTSLDIVQKKLLKSYVQVSSDSGKCYGVVYKGNSLITVSHLFDNINSKAVVQSAGKSYKAKIVALSRERDLAWLKIEDRSFPSHPDITNMFVGNINDVPLCNTWFIRVSPSERVAVQTESTYVKKAISPFGDVSNPNYNLSEKYLTVSFITTKNMQHVIRAGDCGMPLMVSHNNQWYILGIHNSYAQLSAMGHFSFVDKIDMETIVLNTSNSESVSGKWMLTNPVTNKQVLVHPRIYDGIMSTTNSRFSSTMNLDIWGHSKLLNIPSYPKHKKRYHPVEGLEKEKELSPLNYLPHMDSTDLVKDCNGRPHTLFTQARHYTLKTPVYGQWNQDIFEHVESIIKLRYERDYGTPRALNMREIVNGLDNLSGIEMDTSPGPLFKMLFNLTDKSSIFVNKAREGQPPYYEIANNEFGNTFKQIFHNYDQHITLGVPILVLSKDNAKVELVPIEKASKGNVRLFNELCIVFNCILKKYSGYWINEIQKQWAKGPYAMGANHYLLGSAIRQKFSQYDGEIQNTDYSKFDKTIPAELISSFCRVAFGYISEEAAEAFAHSLIYVLHTLEGHIYQVKSGNESGSYVTTFLNCFVVEFVNAYTFAEQYYNRYNCMPSLRDHEINYGQFICGDDATMIVTDKWFSMEDRVRVNSLFNLRLTEAKVDGHQLPSFCSRVIYPHPKLINVAYPALKESSITACLMFYEPGDYEVLAQNCNVALFEASLHNKQFFNKVREAVRKLIKKYNLQEVEWYTYEQYREAFALYVEGINSKPYNQCSTTANTSRKVSNNKIFEQLTKLCKNPQNFIAIIENNSTTLIQQLLEDMNPISVLNNYTQVNGLQAPIYSETSQGPPHDPMWTTLCTTVAVDGIAYTEEGIAKNKQEAKREAASKLVNKFMIIRKANALGHEDKLAECLLNRFQLNIDDDKLHFRVIWKDKTIVDKTITPGKLPGAIDKVITPVYKQTMLKMCIDYILAFANFVQDQGIIFESLYLHLTESSQEQIKHAYETAGAVWEIMKISEDHWFINRMTRDLTCTQIMDLFDDEYAQFITVDKTGLYLDAKQLYGLVRYEQNLKMTNKMEQTKKNMQQSHEIQLNVKSNMDQHVNVNPDMIAGMAVANLTAQVPSGANPQPTEMAPSITPSGEVGQSAVQLLTHTKLNPVGPPNTMFYGGVLFDLKSLCYEQFLDCDLDISWVEGLTAGSILAQIPYDPLGTYINKYIKKWVGDHKRYYGDLLFRITVMGNPLYSGYLAIGWFDKKQTGTTVSISELQKVSYEGKGVTMPWSTVYTLTDARRQYHYRETDETDIDSRPHLVIAPLMTVENPLKDGVKVRIRIATKLANHSDGPTVNPFVVSLPQVESGETIYAPETPGLNGINFSNFYPNLQIYTDGPRSHPLTILEDDYPFTYGEYKVSNSGFGNNVSTIKVTPSYFPFNGCIDSANRDDWPYSGDEFPEDWVPFPYITVSGNHTTRAQGALYASGYATSASIGTRYNKMVTTNSQFTICSLGNDIHTPIGLQRVGMYLVLYGTAKLVTTLGTVYLNLNVLYVDPTKLNEAPEWIGQPLTLDSSIVPTDEPNRIYQPTLNSDAGLFVSNTQTSLPVGYTSILITSIPASALSIEGHVNPTATNEISIIKTIRDLAGTYDSAVQIPQIIARDVRNLAPIFYARFDNMTNELYIKQTDDTIKYAIMPVDNKFISYEIHIVNKTLQFPVTNTTDWVPRTTTTYRKDVMSKVKPLTLSIKANASALTIIGGAALSGLGQGMTSKAQMDNQQFMQSNLFKHENEMQGNMFINQQLMQNTQIDANKYMQQHQFDFSQNMQANLFEQEKAMQARHQEFAKQMRGLNNPAALFSARV